jgi:hypothetical protein
VTKKRIGYTIAELAELSGVGRTLLFVAIKSGLLKAKKWGRRTIILVDDAEEFFKNLPDA